MSYYFTSESVSEGHPDKVSDAISDAILDSFMQYRNPALRCACETLVTTNKVVVAGEYKGVIDSLDVEYLVRRVVKNIGYEQEGFHWNNLSIENLLHGQSPDIALGTDSFGAGDQGIMFGYATKDTETYMPAPLFYSHRIVEMLSYVRKQGIIPWLGPDSKSQVTVEYNDDNTVKRIDKVVCSTQHVDQIDIETVRAQIQEVIQKTLPKELLDENTQYLINPTGRFVVGGPDGDSGVTGRKIIVDTYGGAAPHGGGAFSGKDPSKVDRSAAYMARYLAKNIVASGKSDWATIQLSYAIGVDQPTSVYVESDRDSRDLTKWITQNVDLSADDLQFLGTANEIETAVTKDGTDVKVTLGLPNDVTIGNNLSVTGSFLSDDITAATVTINGNLTVTGTQTTTDSTVVTIADPLFQVGSNTNDNLDRGVTYLHNDGSAKTGFFGMDEGTGVFTYIPDATDSSSVITGSAGAVKFGAVEGTSFSDGTISGVTFVDEDNMSSNSATKVPTQQSVKAYVDAAVTGQDLDFQGDSGGALSIDLDSETLDIAGGTGLSTVGSGNTLTVSLDDTAVTAASYGSTTAIPVLTVDAQGRITAASTAAISTSWTLTGDSGSQVVNGGDTVDIAGGTGLTTVTSATDTLTVNLDDTAVSAGSYGSATAIPTFTVDAQGRLTAAGTAAISSDLTIGADSGSDDVVRVGTDTLNFIGTSNETTTTVSNNTIAVGLASSISGLTSLSSNNIK